MPAAIRMTWSIDCGASACDKSRRPPTDPRVGRWPTCLASRSSPRVPSRSRGAIGIFRSARIGLCCCRKQPSTRTRRTAELFAQRYHAYTGRPLSLTSFDGAPPRTGIILRLEEGQKRLKPQGYTLNVEPGCVDICGADEAGLYYGGVTFFQLLRHALKKPVERPEMAVRGDRRLARYAQPPAPPGAPAHVPQLRGARRPRHRLSHSTGPSASWPITSSTRSISTFRRTCATSAGLSLAVRRRSTRWPTCGVSAASAVTIFIDLCPAWQIGGHANWWAHHRLSPRVAREKAGPARAT